MFTAGILSYSMPVGHTTSDDKVTFKDTSYNGNIMNNIHKDGTGILTNGKFGPDDANQDKRKGWVGWSRNLAKSSFIDITFEFSGVRKFKDVTLTVNVDKKHSYAVFNRSQIFFALTRDNFSNTVQYCLSKLTDNTNYSYSINITLPLREYSAECTKLRLYFGGRWLLISEISFNSGICCSISIVDISVYSFLTPLCANNFAFNIVLYIKHYSSCQRNRKCISFRPYWRYLYCHTFFYNHFTNKILFYINT